MEKLKENGGTLSSFKSFSSKHSASIPLKTKSDSSRQLKKSTLSRLDKMLDKTQMSNIEAKASFSISDKTSQKTQFSDMHTEKTQMSKITPPDKDKFENLKKDVLQVWKSQIIEKQQSPNKTKSHLLLLNASELIFDKTQWELTKWADDAKKNDDILPSKPLNGYDVAVKSFLAPPKTALASDVPGENRQGVGELGDYFNDRPLMSILINVVEIGLAVFAILFSLIASRLLVFAIYVTTINLILAITAVTFVMVWQIRRAEVGEEETPQKTKRYFIKGLFKKMYFDLHYWRAIAYFCCFVIFLYHGTCGDERAGFRTYGFCRNPSYAIAMYLVASVLSVLAMASPITHLVYIKKKIFAIVEP